MSLWDRCRLVAERGRHFQSMAGGVMVVSNTLLKRVLYSFWDSLTREAMTGVPSICTVYQWPC